RSSRRVHLKRGGGLLSGIRGESGSGKADERSSRGLAVGDLDNDGQLEIVIVNMNEPPSLLKNLGPRLGNSLLVRLVTPSGSDAIGARVNLVSGGKKLIEEVRSGGFFISQ